MTIDTVASPALWVGFSIAILLILSLDLGVFHRRPHDISMREAIGWTAIWVSLALLFNGGIWYFFGSQKALEYLAGYLIEKSLSVDNIFIFLIVFSSFSVPKALQHRVLFWGVLGALIMRALFIALGAILLTKFHWIIYPFGALLIWTGLKILIQRAGTIEPKENFLVRLFKRHVPLTPTYHGTAFFIVESGRLFATPLLLVLVTIEVTDLIFAIDSIPAIFAVTTDPFIVYTSNVFAILGLRSLYFALSTTLDRFHYLKTGISLVIIFVGGKMLLSGVIKIPIVISLIVIAGLLGGAIIFSLLLPPTKSHLLIKPPKKDTQIKKSEDL